MQFDIVGGSYQNKYVAVNPQSTINWYIHTTTINDEKPRTQHSLQPTPGLTFNTDTTKSYCRRIFVARTLNYEICFVVADNYLYTMDGSGNTTLIGQMTNMDTTHTRVYMACNTENQVMIVHSSASYIYNMSTQTLSWIAPTGLITFGTVVGAGGSGYVSPTPYVFDSYGIGATATATESGGVINAVAIATAGSGYVSAVCYVLDPTGTGANITLTMSGGTISGYSIVSGGTGYTHPILVIYDSTAPGSGGTVTINNASGIINGIGVLTSGNNYNFPVVGIKDSGGSGATFSLGLNAFPSNPTYLSYTEGYFLVTAGRIYYSQLQDGTQFPALNVFTMTAYSAPTLVAVVWRDDVHCFTTESIEIYINDGVSPFSKQFRGTVKIGLAAIDSLCVLDTGIIFLGRANNGQTRVYFWNGQSCTPLSDSNTTWEFNNPAVSTTTWDKLTTYTWDNWFDAWGATVINSYSEVEYTKDGHIFYFITVPYFHTTHVFDMTSQEWTERQSLSPTSGTQQAFRGNMMVNYLGNNFWTDIYSGKIFIEDYTVATEDSLPITRTRISHVVTQEKKNMSMYSMELDCTIGIGLEGNPTIGGNIDFFYSRDGGNTYSIGQNLSTGANGVYGQRVRAFKLGTARDWVFKLVVTDAVDLAISSAILHGVVDEY